MTSIVIGADILYVYSQIQQFIAGYDRACLLFGVFLAGFLLLMSSFPQYRSVKLEGEYIYALAVKTIYSLIVLMY